MIIIKVMGGLGNQMFQYALYKKFVILGKKVAIDDSQILKEGNQHNGLELERVFGVNYRRATIFQVFRFNYGLSRVMNHFTYKLFKKQVCHNKLIETELTYKPYIYDGKRSVYLEGYWQCEKYFSDIREDILKDFTFDDCVDEKNNVVKTAMTACESVAVHIRRGDYLATNNSEKYGNVCTENYYRKAIEYCNNHLNQPKFYVFSDDIEWVKNSFMNEYDIQYVDVNVKQDSYKDMYLMSNCKHAIIANSSFSWWAAWLNNNPNKIVIMPYPWFGNGEKVDIYCDGWVKMKVK